MLSRRVLRSLGVIGQARPPVSERSVTAETCGEGETRSPAAIVREPGFVLTRPVLQVPDRFNRNSSTVTSLMPAEQSGLWLLERMRGRIGLESLAEKRILDFGCGVRFSQAILNCGLDVSRYVGIECFAAMIAFLRSEVRDPRFEYYFLDAYHPLYNTAGSPLSMNTSLPLAERDFDVASMISVITHQSPSDSEAIFAILRRHVAAEGHLFFTCFLDEAIPSFEDRSPERNGGRCVYNPGFLRDLVERCGWRFVSGAPAEPPLIGDSFVYRPAL
jgi:SAM-dependent methyltransferase